MILRNKKFHKARLTKSKQLIYRKTVLYRQALVSRE